jgi:hypothetical protein
MDEVPASHPPIPLSGDSFRARLFEGEGSRAWARSPAAFSPVASTDRRFPVIQEAIRQQERTIIDLEIQMKTLQEQIDLSRQEYSRLAHQVAPIRRIPDELLSKILSDSCLACSSAHPKQLETIMLTCQWWRQVAISTAALWTDIRFEVDAVNVRNLTAKLVEHLSTWIGRSKNAGLDILLDIDQRIISPQRSNMIHAIFVLLRAHERWNKLTLLGKYSWHCLDTVLSDLDADEMYGSLRSLRFCGMAYLPGHTFSQIRTANIYEIKLEALDCTFTALELLLKSCSNASSLQFNEVTVGSEEDGDSDDHDDDNESLNNSKMAHIVLPQLSNLVFDVKSTNNRSHYLACDLLRQLLSHTEHLKEVEIWAHFIEACYGALFNVESATMFSSSSPAANIVQMSLVLHVEDSGFMIDASKGFALFLSAFPNVEELSFRVECDDTDGGHPSIRLPRNTITDFCDSLEKGIRSLQQLRKLKLIKHLLLTSWFDSLVEELGHRLDYVPVEITAIGCTFVD